MDLPLAEAFAKAVRKVIGAYTKGNVKGVLLSARGPHFCVGGDVQGFAAAQDVAGLLDRSIPPLHQAVHALAGLPVPVVSAVQGSMGGGGIGLALCADLVLGSRSMKLRGGYSAIGLSPDVGSSWFLARLVGPMRAKHIFFTNRVLDAEQCLQAGLVLELYDDEALVPAAEELVQSLARGAGRALARAKALVDQAASHTLEQHLVLEHMAMVASGAGAEAREGMRAFVDKRSPHFRP